MFLSLNKIKKTITRKINKEKNFPTFRVAWKKELGDYLTDSDGRALYYFGHSSMEIMNISPIDSYSEDYLGIWQIFYKEKMIAPLSLKIKDFSIIVRPDEQKQIAYRGHPLYYYTNDQNLGEVKGEGINNMWFVVKIK